MNRPDDAIEIDRYAGHSLRYVVMDVMRRFYDRPFTKRNLLHFLCALPICREMNATTLHDTVRTELYKATKAGRLVMINKHTRPHWRSPGLYQNAEYYDEEKSRLEDDSI